MKSGSDAFGDSRWGSPLRLGMSGRREENGGIRRLSTTLTMVVRELQKEIGLVNDANADSGLLTNDEVLELLNSIQLRLGFELTPIERNDVLAHLEKEARPFGILQELADNPAISDIIITEFSKICVQQGRKNYRTQLSFPSQESYQAFVEKLLIRAGTSCSTKKPIADGMIGSLARIHAVHESLCDSGPYLTIRFNRFSSVQTSDLVDVGFAPWEIMEYLSGLVLSGKSVLIAGEVGTGKTTLARAIAGQIPTEESIVVIEDTPEIRLDHPHVRYLTTREANTEGVGRVSPSECIRAGMRMAMNRIIFGEIRDAEAAESFIDVCASGHPGLSTIHAKSAQEAVTRLELFLGRAQKGVEQRVLSEQVSTAVQAIVHVDICRKTGKRRVMEVREIGAVADGVMRHREMFRYLPSSQNNPQWKVISKASSYKEDLERLDKPIILSKFGMVLDPPDSVLYRESSNSGNIVC